MCHKYTGQRVVVTEVRVSTPQTQMYVLTARRPDRDLNREVLQQRQQECSSGSVRIAIGISITDSNLDPSRIVGVVSSTQGERYHAFSTTGQKSNTTSVRSVSGGWDSQVVGVIGVVSCASGWCNTYNSSSRSSSKSSISSSSEGRLPGCCCCCLSWTAVQRSGS